MYAINMNYRPFHPNQVSIIGDIASKGLTAIIPKLNVLGQLNVSRNKVNDKFNVTIDKVLAERDDVSGYINYMGIGDTLEDAVRDYFVKLIKSKAIYVQSGHKEYRRYDYDKSIQSFKMVDKTWYYLSLD